MEELEDPYPHAFNLKDLNGFVRGLVHPSTMISMRTQADLVPPEATALMGMSKTLSRDSGSEEKQLEKGIVLKVQSTPGLLGALKYAFVFLEPTPIVLEKNAITIIFQRLTPNIKVRVIIPISDVKGEVGVDHRPGMRYFIRKVPTEAARAPKSELTFDVDGNVTKVIPPSGKMLISCPPTADDGNYEEAKASMSRIDKQRVLCSFWVQSTLFLTVFPGKKAKQESSRTIEMTPNGVIISGIIDGSPVTLNLENLEVPNPTKQYGFEILPTTSMKWALIMTGLPQFGRPISFGSANPLSITIYDKWGSSYYMKVRTPFSSLISADVLLSLIVISEEPADIIEPSIDQGGDAYQEENPHQYINEEGYIPHFGEEETFEEIDYI